MGEVVYYYDTDERLRLRGIIPDEPVPEVPSAPPAPPEYEVVPDYHPSVNRVKRAKFTTIIDITGDEPVISRIKVE